MCSDRSFKDRHKRFFAVVAVGKQRWYWVVWPSLALIQTQVSPEHLADGYERTKAEAVDRALEVAGLHGEWVAAKYAKAYHRHLVRRRQNGETRAAPVRLEFLYRDVQDSATQSWYSVPHRVVKKTKKYVYVEQRRYDPTQLSGSWLDHNAPTFRLSRAMLKQEGYALTPIADIDDPLFFTTPYPERLAHYSDQAPVCLSLLDLSWPCTIAEVKAAYRHKVKQVHPDYGGSHEDFLALQAAYEETLRLCRYNL